MRHFWSLVPLTASLTVLSGLSLMAQAQVYPACPAPNPGEYLLLARGQDTADRNRIAALLPAENPVLVCNYLDEVVVRAGGFNSLEAVNSWAVYLKDIEGYEAFVASPQSPAQSPVGNVGEPASVESTAYRPVALPAGYAVLVNYQNQPDVALDVQQQLGMPVGLAVYQSRPYLLAAFSREGAVATALLQTLTEAQYPAILVEAQQVVRLTEQVAP